MTTQTTVTTRLHDPLCGSVYVTRQLSAREAWRRVYAAARLGAAETWCFVGTPTAAQTSVCWLPGRGLYCGDRLLRGVV
jgi:hypothetical protein